MNAQAFQTHLKDSDSNRFQTEVFQVMYHTPRGEARHLLGLRDVTDQGSLTGSKALESLSLARRSLSGERSSPVEIDSDQASEAGGSMEQHLETSFIANDKFLSLQIDMELQVVHASSEASCVGKNLTEQLSSSGLAFLERTWVEAKEEDVALSFAALELRLGPPGDRDRTVFNGTLQVGVYEHRGPPIWIPQ